jgi:hypothetical protein
VTGPPPSPASLPPLLLPPLLLLLLLLLEPPELLELLLPLEDPLEPLAPLLPEPLLVASFPASVALAFDVSSPHASQAPAEAIVSAPMRLIPRSVFVISLPYSGAVADATVS